MSRKKCFIKSIIFGLIIFPCFVYGNVYYVSLNGNNSNGLTWATAWNELNQINWATLQPGDTVYLDGGSTEIEYHTGLTVGKDGDEGAPISIRLSKESGRNGKAIIFGGRRTPMPYCGQTSYSGESETITVGTGISIGAHAWIVIDGTKWEGITIHGTGTGISMGGSAVTAPARDILLKNIKIYDIGQAEKRSDGKWYPQATVFGISFNYRGGGENITIERVIVSCTGDNALGNFSARNIVIRQCWLDNGRTAPNGTPFNYCNHPDGIQTYIYDRTDGPWLIEDTVIGPHFMQGLFPGAYQEQTASPYKYVIVNDITCRNVLFLDNLSSNVLGVNGDNWLFDHITAYSNTGTNNICTQDWISGLIWRDSIFYGSSSYFAGSAGTGSGNYKYNMYGSIPGSTQANPNFVNAAGYDLALQAGSPAAGKGSRITSVAKLFELFPDEGAGSAGIIQFSAGSASVNENAGSAVITVSRLGGSNGVVSVHYATSNATASAGTDFTAKSGTLSWADGDNTGKTFTIGIINDNAIENSETVNITLSNVSAGATLGTPSAVVLTILNDDIVSTDSTPPLRITSVRDGLGTADMDSAPLSTELSANWDESTDPESGVVKYWYAIGRTPGAADIVGWSNNGVETKVTRTNLSLAEGVLYYFTVKAENGVGLQSSPANSDGQSYTAGSAVRNKITVKHANFCRLSNVNSMKFQLDGTEGRSELKIYTISGKLVKAIAMDSGIYEADWNLMNEQNGRIKPGIYLYTISDSGRNAKTGKVVISR